MIWAPEETYSREELQAIQLRKLKQTVAYIYEKVPAYQKKMDKAGVKPGDIQTLKDLEKLPFTNKSDFQENYPTGLFARPRKELVRVHASSGTTGKPTVVGYTRNAWAGRPRMMLHRLLLVMVFLLEHWVFMQDWKILARR